MKRRGVTAYLDEETIKKILEAKEIYEKKVNVDLSLSTFVAKLIIERLNTMKMECGGRDE